MSFMSLLGRTYIVSGGLSGIGLATTVSLLKAGAHVCIADIAPTLPKALSDYSQQAKLTYHGPCDIRVRENCHGFFKNITKERGRINGLVNCAGISPSEGTMASDQIFEDIFSLNVRGTWNLGTEAIQHMSKQEFDNAKSGRGSIVNVGSIASLVGLPSLSAYCTSKHAVLGLTRAWAKDWARQGIRINAVAPGVTNTPLYKKTIGAAESHSMAEDLVAGIPMGRVAEPEEVALTIMYLLSDESSYITGQILPVNGGSV